LSSDTKATRKRVAFVLSASRGKLGFQQHGQHQAGTGAHGWGGVVAGDFEHLHRFIAEIGLAGGENGEGFESHGADRDTIFVEAAADHWQESRALRVGGGILRGGDDDVAAGLALFHGKGCGNFGEQIGAGGENAGLALANEAGEFSGAAMVEGVGGAELADEFTNGGAAWAGEEVRSGGSGVAGFPGTRTIGRVGGARSGRDC
jgi:hypothetical protein